MRVYVFTVCYEQEVEKFKKLCEREGAHVEHVQKIPFRNIWGEEIGFGQWAIIYAHKEELEMEVLC